MSTPSRSALTNALIVDDERDIRELLVLTLGRMGLKCDTASSLKDARALLFCREKNVEREIWDGFRYGPAAACEAFGFDEAWPIDEFEQKLPDLLANRPTLHFALGQNAVWDAKISKAREFVSSQGRAGNAGRPAGY